ncbi:uncharacterized protein LOC131427040 [Malaya genurostris]|uniref:uncharacterized protein LOC131427040 n=1 Tax=Malaya genurostris TaxID=325434 RepID=UPI0026F3B61C|nr:uncharacterized protein LOC131427040 [Malaya genurostris]
MRSDAYARDRTALYGTMDVHARSMGTSMDGYEVCVCMDRREPISLRDTAHRPTENYYIPRGGDRRNPGGKIANKIGNLKQKKRRIDVREAEYAKTRKLTASRELPLDSTTNEAVNWLELNGEPWNTVLEKWSVSAAHRRQYLKNRKFTLKLLNLYPHYKRSYGYQLVDIDFRFLYEDARNGIAVLESTITGIILYATNKAQDPSALKLLKYLNNNTNSLDARMIALLLVLNTVLPPIHAGSRFKPTIYVAQEDTIVFVNKEDEIKSKIDSIYAAYAERNQPIVPKLVVLGEDIDTISGRFFVCYEEVCYELPSVSRATDVLIKLTAVFGLPFSKCSRLVWHFISEVAYGIKHPESYANINRIKTFLNTIHTISPP